MSREAWRMDRNFVAPLSKTWWGFVLDAIPCRSCCGRNKKCPVCEGEGKVWPKVKPPGFPAKEFPYAHVESIDKGYGWQMWETTSEGSPISPVCESPEALAQWLADNRASTFGNMTATYEQWLKMIQVGHAFSMMVDSRGMQSGVTAVAEAK